jgi:hypothetical protein
MLNTEFVLEFVVRNVSCRNTSVRSSPLMISLPGCPPLPLNARTATIGKITYERGKRVTFSHSHLSNLQALIHLLSGHGDQTIRASCSVDFFNIASVSDDRIPTVYDVEVGMDRPNGDRFGILNIAFQLISLREFSDLICPAQITPRVVKFQVATDAAPAKPSPAPVKRISISKQEPSRAPSAAIKSAHGPDLSHPVSSRSALSSIHERYMKRNELWIGHHASTHADGDSRRGPSRSASGQGSARSSAV